jgi:hypothetical protein
VTQDFGFQREINDTCPESALSVVLLRSSFSSALRNDDILTNSLNGVSRLARGGSGAVFRQEASSSLQRRSSRRRCGVLGFFVVRRVKATNLPDIGKRTTTESRTGNDFVPVKGTNGILADVAAIGLFYFFLIHNVMDSTVRSRF